MHQGVDSPILFILRKHRLLAGRFEVFNLLLASLVVPFIGRTPSFLEQVSMATLGRRKQGAKFVIVIGSVDHLALQRGDDVAKVKVHGPPKIADRNPDFPFVTVSPLLGADQDWDVARLDALLDHVTKTLRIDRSRIYLTGLSRGGHASWRWAMADPGRFAAVAPVAGYGDTSTACALKDKPVWAFHGDRDDVVKPEGSFAMQRAIRACGGLTARLTIYPDLGHNAWDPAYDDPSLYLWLLSHRLPQTKDKK